MRTVAGIALTSLLLGLTACGAQPSSAGDFEGEERDVAEVVENLQTSAQRGEADTICADLLHESLREQVAAGGESCDEQMRLAVEDADAFDLAVEEVTLQGSRATVLVRGDAGEDPDVERTFELENDAGRWRVTSFGEGS